jgi:hypothetical protein
MSNRKHARPNRRNFRNNDLFDSFKIEREEQPRIEITTVYSGVSGLGRVLTKEETLAMLNKVVLR